MSRTYRNKITRHKIKRKHRRPRKSSRNNIKALIKSYEETGWDYVWMEVKNYVDRNKRTI
ncbi:hypothetical protein DRN58_01230 [Thermococci archaeon]|nr:MAG: hypothetical protein DRN58_01230 [Thermococci archaeon]